VAGCVVAAGGDPAAALGLGPGGTFEGGAGEDALRVVGVRVEPSLRGPARRAMRALFGGGEGAGGRGALGAAGPERRAADRAARALRGPVALLAVHGVNAHARLLARLAEAEAAARAGAADADARGQLLAVTPSAEAALGVVAGAFGRGQLALPRDSAPDGAAHRPDPAAADAAVVALAGGAPERCVCGVDLGGGRRGGGGAAAARLLKAAWRAGFRALWAGVRPVGDHAAALEGWAGAPGAPALCVVLERQNGSRAMLRMLRPGASGPAAGLLGGRVACTPTRGAGESLAFALVTAPPPAPAPAPAGGALDEDTVLAVRVSGEDFSSPGDAPRAAPAPGASLADVGECLEALVEEGFEVRGARLRRLPAGMRSLRGRGLAGLAGDGACEHLCLVLRRENAVTRLRVLLSEAGEGAAAGGAGAALAGAAGSLAGVAPHAVAAASRAEAGEFVHTSM